eukprot:3374559-Amphidinium_carterae.2
MGEMTSTHGTVSIKKYNTPSTTTSTSTSTTCSVRCRAFPGLLSCEAWRCVACTTTPFSGGLVLTKCGTSLSWLSTRVLDCPRTVSTHYCMLSHNKIFAFMLLLSTVAQISSTAVLSQAARRASTIHTHSSHRLAHTFQLKLAALEAGVCRM